MTRTRISIVFLTFCCLVNGLSAQSNRFELELNSPVLQVATTSATQDTPAAAFNPNTKQFFVVWAHRKCDPRTGCNANVRGRFINQNGSMTSEKVYSWPLDQGDVFQIDLAHNMQLNNFLLSWYGEMASSAGLFTRVVSANGSPDARSLAAPTTSADSISYQPVTNQYLVSSSGYLLLSSQGLALGEPISPTGADFFPLIFSDTSGGFTVLAERNRKTITMQKVSQTGQLQGAAVNVISKKANDFELFSAAYNPIRNEYLVTTGGEITPDGRRQIKAFIVSGSGVVLSGPKTVAIKTAESFTITRNAIAFADRAYLVVFLRDGHLWIRSVDIFGRPVGKQTRLTEVAATHVEASILYDSSTSRALIVWQRALGEAHDIHARFVKWTN